MPDKSGFLNSHLVLTPRPVGILIKALRFLFAQDTYVGASNPGISRLYELTVGFNIHVISLTYLINPEMKYFAVSKISFYEKTT